MREAADLIDRAADTVIAALRTDGKNPEETVRRSLRDLFYEETGRKPLVIPLVVE
jgi:mRNA degradation ribonuclease J1/J2